MNDSAIPDSPGVGYRLLSLPLWLFWILHGLKHGLKHGLRGYLSKRMFGFDSASGEQVWVHASSVGEVRAVAPLVQALIDAGESILFTSFTATGYRAIRKQFPGSVTAGVIPFDNWWHCRRFFERQPIKLGLVMETELWPELLYQARRQGVNLLLLNARLSNKSLDAQGFVRHLLQTTLGYFSRILTRGSRDRDDLLSLGADADRVTIIGNLKSRIEPSQPQTRLVERDYLVLASSHRGEERQFLESRPEAFAETLLVLAPRHPDRSAEIQAQIEQLGLSYAVRSKGQALASDTEVYLADTLGELGALMAYARVVVMGGSFDDTGGHNLLEPASLGCAIITGPSDTNIVEDIEILGNGSGVLQVANMADCWREITRLLAQPGQAKVLGQQARSRLAQQPDIAEEYLAVIREYL